MTLLQFVPLIHEANPLATDFVEAVFIVDHVLASSACHDVVGSEIDGLLGADFLTHAAVDAADHVDVELLGAFLDLGPLVSARDFTGRDFDGFGRADEFTELAGDAAFAVLLVGVNFACTSSCSHAAPVVAV